MNAVFFVNSSRTDVLMNVMFAICVARIVNQDTKRPSGIPNRPSITPIALFTRGARSAIHHICIM